jgi:dihydropteroate synthase
VVGVLNATPDSFSDGGRLLAADGRPDLAAVLAAARALVAAGADVLDVGGESTRPGAEPVPAAVERARTRPVIEALAKTLAVPLSIDTRRSVVAEAALEAGARVVNDVSGLRHDPALAALAARAGATLVLGHLRGEPADMQHGVHFDDVLAEVGDELALALERAQAAGVARERLVDDPGVPVLVGPSRKAFLGELTGEPVGARDAATASVCSVAVFAGADAVRVHDVAGARRAVAIGRALRGARETRA